MSDYYLFSGVVTSVLPVSEGVTSSGYQWRTRVFTLNDGEGRLAAFSLRGPRVDEFSPLLEVGDRLSVRFYIESREWNGRFYTTLTVFDVRLTESPEPDTPEPKAEDRKRRRAPSFKGVAGSGSESRTCGRLDFDGAEASDASGILSSVRSSLRSSDLGAGPDCPDLPF